MKTRLKILLIIIVSLLIFFGAVEYTTINDRQVFFLPIAGKKEERKETTASSTSEILVSIQNIKTEAEKLKSTSSLILLDAPFTSQAPFGEWSDQRQQDGCEETSALMAVAWARGEKLSKKKAKKEILAIAEYEKNKYGSFADTNAEDTVIRIIKGYFGYGKSKVLENISVDQIKAELYKGNLVLVPCNGRRLGNPNYTAPGPERHMLVIRGYDLVKKEFITNDGGTRKGENYRYKDDILFKAIVDYPTGDHEPIEKESKTMIIVWK